MGPLIYGFLFPINTCTIFDLWFGSLWMWRANCMHCSTPLYIEDLNMHRFWYPQGALEPVPRGYWRATKFWESQKLYVDFQLLRRFTPLTPTLVKDQLYFKSMNYTLYDVWIISVKLHMCVHTHTYAHTFIGRGKEFVGRFWIGEWHDSIYMVKISPWLLC